MTLSKQVFSLFDAPGRSHQYNNARGCSDKDEEQSGNPEGRREAKLTGLDLGVAERFVGQPDGDAQSNNAKSQGTPFQHAGGRWCLIRWRHEALMTDRAYGEREALPRASAAWRPQR